MGMIEIGCLRFRYLGFLRCEDFEIDQRHEKIGSELDYFKCCEAFFFFFFDITCAVICVYIYNVF